MKLPPVTPEVFAVPAAGPSGPVIGIIPGKIVTEHLTMSLPYANGQRHVDLDHDALKIAVLARHGVNRNVGRGFVKGFGFKAGALASSVGHDSHNVCVVGATDADMALAVNRVIAMGGGFAAVMDGSVLGEAAFPVAGLVSLKPFPALRAELVALRAAVRARFCCIGTVSGRQKAEKLEDIQCRTSKAAGFPFPSSWFVSAGTANTASATATLRK